MQAKNYEEGFMNFVSHIEEQDDVKIEKEWWSELLSEISSLPEEVAFIKESDIENAILKFEKRKRRPTVIPDTPSPSSEPEPQPGVSPIPAAEVPEDLVDKARDAVKATNMPNMMWQKVLLDLIEENPWISQYIADYLS